MLCHRQFSREGWGCEYGPHLVEISTLPAPQAELHTGQLQSERDANLQTEWRLLRLRQTNQALENRKVQLEVSNGVWPVSTCVMRDPGQNLPRTRQDPMGVFRPHHVAPDLPNTHTTRPLVP